MRDNDLPINPGTYALLLKLEREGNHTIGALGEFELRRGYYLYLGSAFGPGGLYGRLCHHLRLVNRPRWHIDYLRPACYLEDIWYSLDPIHREHFWAETARNFPKAEIPIPRFGASDCCCITHLVYYSTLPRWDHFRQDLISTNPDHFPIFRFNI